MVQASLENKKSFLLIFVFLDLDTTIPLWIHPFSSDQGSQPRLGLFSTKVGDHLGNASVVSLFYFFDLVIKTKFNSQPQQFGLFSFKVGDHLENEIVISLFKQNQVGCSLTTTHILKAGVKNHFKFSEKNL